MLEIVYKKVTDLIPYVNNARVHSEAQVNQIVSSMKEFQFTNPILTDGDNGIIAGHGRLMAARKMGMESVPTVELSHLSPAQKKAYIIADNKMALAAEWDDELLSLEFKDLEDMDFDLELTGFSLDEIEAFDFDAGETEGLTDADEVPEVPEEPVSKLGDVWLLGKHRVMCGDSTSITDVEKLMDGKKADLCLTDPPYGIGDTKSDKNNYDVYDDSLENLKKLIADFLPIAQSVANIVVLTPGNKNQYIYPTPTWTMAWFVPAGTGMNAWGFSCWQPILCYGKDIYLANGLGSRPDALCKTESSDNSLGHPCSKPVGVWEWFIERCSINKNDLIFDPFLGSGTTIIAAEKTNRICYGLELSPNYVDVIVNRWQNFTGHQATLEATGQTFNEVKEALSG
jgi:DNA modification methylase